MLKKTILLLGLLGWTSFGATPMLLVSSNQFKIGTNAIYTQSLANLGVLSNAIPTLPYSTLNATTAKFNDVTVTNALTGNSSTFYTLKSTNTAAVGDLTAQTVIVTNTATFRSGATIGSSGSLLTAVISNTGTLDFPSINTLTSADLTITVTGAVTGNAVFLGLPATPTAGIVFNAFVSASDTVTVRAHNYTGGSIDPASATYRVTVVK